MITDRLNLGSGKDIRKGYINVDISPDVGAEYVMDFRTIKWPFLENQFFHVIANNSLTQISDGKDFVRIMNNLWYSTHKDGMISIRVPRADHICAWQDPMDSRRFTPESFTYMQYDHRRYEQYGKHYGFKPFHVKLVKDNGIQMEFELCPVK